jgi:hypothetical protein
MDRKDGSGAIADAPRSVRFVFVLSRSHEAAFLQKSWRILRYDRVWKDGEKLGAVLAHRTP